MRFLRLHLLEQKCNASTVDTYLEELTRGFHLDNMIGAFYQGLLLFTLSRAGGIPVPTGVEGTILWSLVVAIQVCEWLLVVSSSFMIVLVYFHVRHYHRSCMYEVEEGSMLAHIFSPGSPVADIAGALTLLVIPVINQALMLLFIYSYVISSFLKVFWAVRHDRVRHGYMPIESNQWKTTLPTTDQPFLIARAHIVLAYCGLLVPTILSCATIFGLVASICFFPEFVLMICVIKCTYACVLWMEDDFAQGKHPEVPEPGIRMVTGWLRDVSAFRGRHTGHRCAYLNTFRVLDIIKYPLVLLPGKYREDELGDAADIGGGDADFVTMVYGFGTFFVIIALAPATCYGIWISVPVFGGSLTYAEAFDLVLMYWEELLGLCRDFALSIVHLELHWDWPEWFDPVLIWHFVQHFDDKIEEVWKTITDRVFGWVLFLHFDVDDLIVASRVLLEFNSVLAAVKPLVAAFAQLWIMSSNSLASCMQCYSKPHTLEMILFGECIPGKRQLRESVVKRNLRNDKRNGMQMKYIINKYRESYSLADYKLVFAVADLKSAEYTAHELRRALFTFKELKRGGFDAASLKKEGFAVADLKAEYTAHELTGAGYGILEISYAFGKHAVMEMLGRSIDAASMRQSMSQEELNEHLREEQDIQKLREAGFAASELHGAGVKVEQLREGGFTEDNLEAFLPAPRKLPAPQKGREVRV